MHRKRRITVVLLLIIFFVLVITINSPTQTNTPTTKTVKSNNTSNLAIYELNKVAIKGRAPKTKYSREQFGADWSIINGCDTRNIILNRDLSNAVVDERCNVVSGTLNDPYTGKTIQFKRGSDTSGAIQIDHVVSLSDAWQKGAQQLTSDMRIKLANDPLELLAVDGPANQQKSDSDAASWLPPNKSFRCQYVARQIAVKLKYNLWVTSAEHDVIANILNKCSNQMLPNP